VCVDVCVVYRTCLSGLESLSALEVLRVDHNQLSDPQALLTLTHSLPSLTQVKDSPNPTPLKVKGPFWIPRVLWYS
jgi:hypothetical protein